MTLMGAAGAALAATARRAKAVGVACAPAPVPSYWCCTALSYTGRAPASTAVHSTVKLTLFPCCHYLHHPNETQR